MTTTIEPWKSNCRIVDNIELARPGDRVFIATRKLTLKSRVVNPGWPFTESAIIDAGDIDGLIESGELKVVGELGPGKVAEYLKKYEYLGEPLQLKKGEKL